MFHAHFGLVSLALTMSVNGFSLNLVDISDILQRTQIILGGPVA